MPTKILNRLRWPLRPRWLCLFGRSAHCEGPPSRLHGMYGFSISTGSTLYAIVPFNLLLFVLRELWFAVLNPAWWIKVHIRKDDDQRHRGIEFEWRLMQRACHAHRLIWTGDRFITYDQAEAMANDPTNRDPALRRYP